MGGLPGMDRIVDDLLARLAPLRFSPPTVNVYNPLIYARQGFDQYVRFYARAPQEIVLLGMNPGPWGMAQTGVPFGDVGMVEGWLGIHARVDAPRDPHPKRPVQGFDCPRGEVSGQRLWGWARECYGTPQRFFRRFWVANYCPLVFMEHSGRNRTPDKLKKAEKTALFKACDAALRQTVELMQPRHVIGVGAFAARQAREALCGLQINIGRISHPSPANPKANRGWSGLVQKELAAQGIDL